MPKVPASPLSGRNGGDHIARTIADVTGALERAVFSDELARLQGLLQGVDPRAKVVAALLLLATVGLARSLAVVLGVYALVVLLAGLSGLPIVGFNKRVWLGVPLFAAFVVLPSLFMLPGQPILSVLDGPPFQLAVTDSGLASALLLVARVGTSVALALLLISTTRWTELLRALRVLLVPESFVVVLGMTHRYLFLFLRATSNLLLARASRTVGETSGGEQRRWTAAAAGTLMSRSVRLSGDVLLAMRARGFDGEIRSLSPPRMRDADRLLLAVGVVLAAGALLVDRL